ncbi:MAG TPA: Rid family hydrolase, partial [Planctomycetota bacterium]|nr:Rid family hydrolase [Planctomycetota bacterium]
MTDEIRPIATDAAPAAIGPYSQAVACASMLYCSGQIGLDPTTMQLGDGGTLAELDQELRNLAAGPAPAG